MKSYIVTCSTAFRDAALALARRKQVSVSDLVTAVIVLKDHLNPLEVPDPGDADRHDRDDIVLKSGARAGRVLRRKPRLQLRLHEGLSDDYIRRALALLLAIDAGERVLLAEDEDSRTDTPDETHGHASRQDEEMAHARQHAEEMRALVSLMTFEPLANGVRTLADALYVLGLPPGMHLTRRVVKARFRMLSHIYHPDKETGDTTRMAQLIDASRMMEDHLRRYAAE